MNEQDKLSLLIAGVAALEGTPQHHVLAALLAEDLLAFRKSSGIEGAWEAARMELADQRNKMAGVRADRMKREGPKLWAVLHRRALSLDRAQTFDPESELTWFKQSFLQMIPCGDCKTSYRAFVDKSPPETALAVREVFKWTVALHNFVNSKLGKAEISQDEARLLWAA